jgi:hypothetical protein
MNNPQKFDLDYFKKDIREEPLKYIMMIISLSGAFLTAGSFSFLRGLGFFVWLFSNMYVILIFYKQNNLPMSFAYIGYEIANLIGVYNNWLV